ncbi:MAG: hypothetical protein PHP86_08600 [Nevskiales bacterium]|nr:hypothetical protein [Nevskiales bacterium]
MTDQERMRLVVQRAIQTIGEIGRHGITPDRMPDDLISAQAKLEAALEHLEARIALERLLRAA